MKIQDLVTRLQMAMETVSHFTSRPPATVIIRCPRCTHCGSIKDVLVTRMLENEPEVYLIQELNPEANSPDYLAIRGFD